MCSDDAPSENKNKKNPFRASWAYRAALISVPLALAITRTLAKTARPRIRRQTIASRGMPVYSPAFSGRLLINRPRRDDTLSCCWYTAAIGEIWTRDLVITLPDGY